jgi:hypothetical protein
LPAGGCGSFSISAKRPKRVVGHDAEAGQQRQLLHRLVGDLRGDLPGLLDRELAAAVRRRGEPQEVDVVRVVAHRVQALGLALGDVVLVGLGRQVVALDGVREAADALVDVRGHVDHVARTGHQRHQEVGRLLRLLRVDGLHQVDVQVQRQRVLRVLLDHRLHQRRDLRRALVRRAVRHPVAPRPQVHHRLRVHGGDVEVLRVLLLQRAHRGGVGLVARLAVLLLAGVALGQRVDHVALARRRLRLQRDRLLRQLVGLRLVVGVHRRVDVRPQHQRLAPVRHRAVRVEARRLPERTPGLGVVEAVGEVQALADELLRPGGGGADLERVRPEVLQPRRELSARPRLRSLRRVLVVLVRLGAGGTGARQQRDQGELLHWTLF